MPLKLSIKKGQRAPDIVATAGTAIAGSDAMELNIDVTNMNRQQAADMLHHLYRKVAKEMPWPPA